MSVKKHIRRTLRHSTMLACLLASIFSTSPLSAQAATGSCSLQAGRTYRSYDSSAVYLVTDQCTKRPFFNQDRYFSFFDSWNSVSFVAQSALNAIPDDTSGLLPWGPRAEFGTGSLVKVEQKPEIYLISEDKATPIADEQVLKGFGLSVKDVEEVADTTLSKFNVQQAVIKTPADLPEPVVFKYQGSPEVYLLQKESEEPVKAHVESMDVLSMVARPDRILVLPTTVSYSDTTPVTKETVSTVRNRKRSSGPTIPVVEPVVSDDQPVDNSGATGTTEGDGVTNPGHHGSYPTNDTTRPRINSFHIPETGETNRRVPVTFDAQDDRGIYRYFFSESPTAPTSDMRGWMFATTTYTFPEAVGTRTLYAWVKDEAGNISERASSTIRFPSPDVDVTPPTILNFSLPEEGVNRRVAVHMEAEDDKGIYRYFFSENPRTPSPSMKGWTFATTTYTFPDAYGWRWLYVWVKDEAGHVSHRAHCRIHFPERPGADTIAPIVSAFEIADTSDSLEVSIIELTATDDRGIVSYLVTESPIAPQSTSTSWLSTAPTSYLFTEAGTKTLYAWAKDSAGNVSTYASATTIITLPDVTAPVITAFEIPSASNSLIVPITLLTATDDQAVAGYIVNEIETTPSADSSDWLSVAPTSYTFTEGGNKTLYAWVKDVAGNISSSVTVSVMVALPAPIVDTQVPTITAFTLPSTGTSRVVPILSFEVTDDIGITGYFYKTNSISPTSSTLGWAPVATSTYTFSNASGTKTLYVWVKDAVGNVSNYASASTVLSSPSPIISNIQSTLSTSSSTSVTISWDTDLESTSNIIYGLTTKYGGSLTLNDLTTSHALDLTNLVATTTPYHFRVASRTSEWVNTTSTDQTFQLSF